MPTVLLSGRRRSRAHCAALIALATALTPSVASAQYPGELHGRVSDAISGAPVENALVEVIGTGLTRLSDGRGHYRLRGLEPGRHSVRFTRMGYESLVLAIEIQNGETAWLVVRLGARPIELQEVRAAPSAAHAAETAAGVITIDRDEIEGSGEHTAAGLLEGRAGLVVQRRGPVGRQTVSIRGSSADQVLVLLDGAPFGDPLTGAADLSTVPASGIESITVLKGSQSARFGPGAEAGVVLIETRGDAAPLAARLETGSLGSWSASAETSGGDPGLAWSAGGYARTIDGQFEYRAPDGLGGGDDTRVNNDLSEANLFVAANAFTAGGDLRIRAGLTRLDRGLPGPSYQPTPDAREELTRWNGQAGWERQTGGSRFTAAVHGVFQRTHFSDPEPPLGLPYDSRTDALSLGGRLVAETSPSDRVHSLSAGLELRGQRYASDAFDELAPSGRIDLGLFAGGQFAAAPAGSPQLRAALRLDRDGLEDLWRLTHELTLTASAGFATFHLRHASSYSPPTFGDQFFREGVLVQPNPELRAERVPNDLSVGAALEGLIGGTSGRFAVDLYIADVKDMIIWAPDFRFVWSPRNFDVKRRGLDVEGSIEFTHLTLRAAYSYARVTYDRPDDDTVQVMYRPRHSGSIGARWKPARWEINVDARYIGQRYPVPAPLNALDPYWTVDLRLRRSFDAGTWQITPTLAVDRLFDNDDSLIFGYPEPGRVLRLELAARPR